MDFISIEVLLGLKITYLTKIDKSYSGYGRQGCIIGAEFVQTKIGHFIAQTHYFVKIKWPVPNSAH